MAEVLLLLFSRFCLLFAMFLFDRCHGLLYHLFLGILLHFSLGASGTRRAPSATLGFSLGANGATGPASAAVSLSRAGGRETGTGNQTGNSDPGKQQFKLVPVHTSPFRLM